MASVKDNRYYHINRLMLLSLYIDFDFTRMEGTGTKFVIGHKVLESVRVHVTARRSVDKRQKYFQ